MLTWDENRAQNSNTLFHRTTYQALPIPLFSPARQFPKSSTLLTNSARKPNRPPAHYLLHPAQSPLLLNTKALKTMSSKPLPPLPQLSITDSLLHITETRIMPLLFLAALLLSGWGIYYYAYSSPVSLPLPRPFALGTLLTFSILILLTAVLHSFIHVRAFFLRRRRQRARAMRCCAENSDAAEWDARIDEEQPAHGSGPAASSVQAHGNADPPNAYVPYVCLGRDENSRTPTPDLKSTDGRVQTEELHGFRPPRRHWSPLALRAHCRRGRRRSSSNHNSSIAARLRAPRHPSRLAECFPEPAPESKQDPEEDPLQRHPAQLTPAQGPRLKRARSFPLPPPSLDVWSPLVFFFYAIEFWG